MRLDYREAAASDGDVRLARGASRMGSSGRRYILYISSSTINRFRPGARGRKKIMGEKIQVLESAKG